MQIERIFYPITSLGPGERLVIWTNGCTKQCKNCANPELWKSDPKKEVDVNVLNDLIISALKNKKVDGITITGGDPLEQMSEMAKLLPLLIKITDDILVYTGYTMAEISDIHKGENDMSHFSNLNNYISVLIDGPYHDNQNDNLSGLRGSVNQNLIFFDESKREKYETYLSIGRTIQNVFHKDKMISVGIHNNNT